MGSRLILALLFVSLTAGAAEDAGFLAFGDWGMGNAQQRTVARGMETYCRTELCQFALSLGDNFYPSGVRSVSDPFWSDRFEKIYGPLGLVFYSSLGNHDYGGNVQAQIEYGRLNPRWVMPGRFYDFTRGDIAFFVVDTNAFDATQAVWLKGKLEASTATWKLVYGHHPIYSYGVHGNTPKLVRELLPVLKGRADFFVCGHDHDKQVLTAEEGVAFVVSGTAADTRPVRAGSRTIFKSSEPGFSAFRARGREMTVRMLRADGSVEFEKAYGKP